MRKTKKVLEQLKHRQDKHAVVRQGTTAVPAEFRTVKHKRLTHRVLCRFTKRSSNQQQTVCVLIPCFVELVRVEEVVLRQLSAARKSRSCDQGCHRSAAISEILDCFPKMFSKWAGHRGGLLEDVPNTACD